MVKTVIEKNVSTSPDLCTEYLGGTDMALSLNGVAELRVKKEVLKEADGGTEDDLTCLSVSKCGTCLGTEDDLRVLFS